MHEQDLIRTDQRLNAEQQQALLLLASRLQQEHEDSATLADMIKIGEEVGLKREIVEAAFLQVVSQPTEQAIRREHDRSVGNELGAIHVTLVWILATWLAVIFGQPNETVGTVVGFATLLFYPVVAGVLVRRPWFAAALASGVVMNLLIAFSVRFGPPTHAGARADLLILLVPVVIAFVVSLFVDKIAPKLNRSTAK